MSVEGSKDWGGEGVAGDHIEHCERSVPRHIQKNVTLAYLCRCEVRVRKLEHRLPHRHLAMDAHFDINGFKTNLQTCSTCGGMLMGVT